MAKDTRMRFVERATRLYEQEAGEPLRPLPAWAVRKTLAVLGDWWRRLSQSNCHSAFRISTPWSRRWPRDASAVCYSSGNLPGSTSTRWGGGDMSVPAPSPVGRSSSAPGRTHVLTVRNNTGGSNCRKYQNRSLTNRDFVALGCLCRRLL